MKGARNAPAYEQGDGDEKDDEHAHHDDLAALDIALHGVINLAATHLLGAGFLVAVDEVEGHGGAGREHQRCQGAHRC